MAGTQPNTRLRALMQQADLGNTALARLMHELAAQDGGDVGQTSKSSVSHWLNGVVPHPLVVPYLLEALSQRLDRPVSAAEAGVPDPGVHAAPVQGMDPDPAAAVARLGRMDVNRRTLLATSMAWSVTAMAAPLLPHLLPAAPPAGGVRVGQAEIDTVVALTAAMNAADERLGGGYGRSMVAEYLATDVATYLGGTYATEQARKAMFAAGAQVAYLAGWKAYDVGQGGLAQRYYLHSFQLAEVADPNGQAGYAMRILVHQAIKRGRSEHCVDLAHAALDRVRGHVDPHTEALFWSTCALAHAHDGDRREALAGLGRAEALTEQDTGDDPGPRWSALGGSAQARLASHAGETLAALGDLRAAESNLARAAAGWNQGTHPRVWALTLADVAAVQVRRGHVEQGCATWRRAAPVMAGVDSARNRRAWLALGRQLHPYAKRGNRDAAALLAGAGRVRAGR